MNECLLISCLVLAQIRHNGKHYAVGDIVCLSANDKLFLEKVGYVRVASADEIAKFEQANPCQTPTHTAPNATTLSPLGDDSSNANSNSHLENTDGKGESDTDSNSETALPVSDTAPSGEPVSVQDYGKLTKVQLIDELNKRQIPHNAKAKNDELIALLVASDAPVAVETADEEMPS